jgi:alanine racemase
MDAKATLGEPRVLISRRALLHNVRVIRRALLSPATTKVCAIIKADAYGHGAKLVADALTNFSSDEIEGPAVDALAVASIDEAGELPVGNGPVLPVIVFRPLENLYLGRQRQAVEHAVRSGWTLTLCSPPAADDLARVAASLGKRANVQVMVDTGMTRSGVCADRCDELLHRIEHWPSLRLGGLCTHFARADEPDSAFTRVQILRFHRATESYAAAHAGKIVRHAANSGGLFFFPQTQLDMVRPGLALFGIDPGGEPSPLRPLRPALRWTAPLVNIRDIRAGVGVGYGQTWKAPRDSRIGLVPVGYADGYPRCYGGRAAVIVHGQPCPVVGRISMDLTTVDLTDCASARTGDEVTLLSDDPVSPASVYAHARWSDTIPYEVLCRIGPRVKRVAVDPEDVTDRTAPSGRDGAGRERAE